MDRELREQMEDLTSYIQGNGGYQTVPLDPSVAELGNRDLSEQLAPVSDDATRRLTPEALSGTLVGDALSGATGNVDSSSATGQSGLGVTPQSGQPVVDVAQLQREFERVQNEATVNANAARSMAQLAARREHDAFVARLNATVQDPNERVARYNQFRLQQEQVRTAALQGQINQINADANQQREMAARNQLISEAARDNGITDPELVQFLYDAQSPDHLQDLVQRVKRLAVNSQTAQTQVQREQRINAGVDVAGGASAGFTPPKQPKERSGDLIGLIRSRGHSVIPTYIEQ